MSKSDDLIATQQRTPADRSVPAYPINKDGANHDLTPVDDNPKQPKPVGSLHTISPTQPLKPMREDLIATGGDNA